MKVLLVDDAAFVRMSLKRFLMIWLWVSSI